MSEPLKGNKTNILALVMVLVQAAKVGGLIDDNTSQLVDQLIAAGMSITLLLKARRAVVK